MSHFILRLSIVRKYNIRLGNLKVRRFSTPDSRESGPPVSQTTYFFVILEWTVPKKASVFSLDMTPSAFRFRFVLFFVL